MIRYQVPRLIEIIGLSWALGIAYLTAVYFVCYLCGLSLSYCIALSTAAALALTGMTIFWTRLTHMPEATPVSRSTTYLRLVAICAAIIPLVATAWMALRSPLAGWDGWSVWAYKAEAFATGGPPLSYFRDQISLQTHPDYPLNLPIAESMLLHLPGGIALPLVTMLGPACHAALLCLLYAGLVRIYHSSTTAALGIAILAGLPVFIYNAPGGGADVPLSLYTGGTAIYLLAWWTHRAPRDAILAGLCAGAAIWTKKEGLALAALVAVVYTGYELTRARRPLSLRRLPSLKRVIAPLIAMCLIPLPWLVFLHIERPLPRDFDPVTLTTFIKHLARLLHVVPLMVQQMLTWNNWGVFWIVLGFALALSLRRLALPERGLAALLLGQLSIYIVVFVFSNWHSYISHAQGTFDRLLLQAAPAAVLLLIACAHHSTLGAIMGRNPRTIPSLRQQYEEAV